MVRLKNSLFILLGAGLFAFGLNYLIMPNRLFEGGATGLTLIIYYLFRIQPWIMNIVFNIPLFILGWKILGKKTLYLSLLGTLSVTVWLAIFEKIHFSINLQQDLILVSILGGILMGLGLGIIFRAGGTTGGSDIIARIGHKYTSFSIGQIILAVDILVLTLIVIVFKDLRTVLYTLMMVAVASKVIDFVTEGGYGSKGVMIVSQKSEQLAQAIDNEIERGVTLIKAQGFYSKTDVNMIYSVIYKSQLQEMKELIRRIDPHAFITITDAHEVLGEGFTLDRDKEPLERH
ncbi:YitT family protein [Streptococcus ruminantium]|uniref:YitT family protein n=1 Tax=Streptococcus ruminantium TaxID=1917441 RepID=A0ABU1B118_9STRE|nr:YitT family protein [Streptococcus ruminantium]MDQ8758905.1 YitT family protein [Streptococcus ruminantium]MDQ8764151.1 YitT family protein [Streptococcus ruminantium]MDQ8766553.1 YitT family protein [Streptococcus ruminantium]MDQ8768734.1 YitT family protein [Streptococcus ruminantium]MDQ8774204.1 YitT family protein [Streptococcus ruminantium]